MVGSAGCAVTVADEPKPDAAAAKAKEPASPEHISKLIRELGNKDYYVRQRAQDELARLGFEAFDALNLAAADEDPEIAFRAKYLLRLMRVEWTTPGDPSEVKKCLRNYESQDALAREGTMRALADLPNGQGVAALCRLARFEKSPLSNRQLPLAATIFLF